MNGLFGVLSCSFVNAATVPMDTEASAESISASAHRHRRALVDGRKSGNWRASCDCIVMCIVCHSKRRKSLSLYLGTSTADTIPQLLS